MYMEKVKVSQDVLYQFLMEHGIKLVRLAELTGLSEASINSCFKHQLINNGTPRVFTRQALLKMTEALEQIANALRGSVLKFGSDQVYTNQRGATYDPALVEPLKKIGCYMNLTALVERVLGWNQKKKENVLVTRSSKAYGTISEADATAINNELLAVAGVLSSYEVVGDVSGNGSTQAAESKEDNKGKRTRMEQSFESKAYPWDDTSLTLQERTRLVRERWPNGILFFRVNGGYTLEGDDARFAESIDGRIYSYTDAASGQITAYMDEEVLQSVLPKMISQYKCIAFTDMY